MRRVSRFSLTLLLIAVPLADAPVAAQATGPDKVIESVRHDTSAPLRDLAKAAPTYQPGIPSYEVPNRASIYAGAPQSAAAGLDPVRQATYGSAPVGPPLVNFEGMGRFTGGAGSPPDTVGDVGPNHYFQSVNTSIQIYDKSGNTLLGPVPNNTLWDGFGGTCESQNAGDPILVYDPLADRWLMSQFTSPGGGSATECIAISTGPDPTGSYHRYQFPTPGNDYPKLSVWPDGYYAGIRNFSGSFNFDAYAFERPAMLVGDPAEAVVFNMSALLGGITNFLPADVDGPTPPAAGTPGIFVGMEDPSIVLDELTMFELDVDWTNPANSALTGPDFIPVAAFNGNVCNFFRNCVPQPNTNQGVDGFADATMHRLAYRNFGTHESMVLSHTVDVGDFEDHAGIRWHELRNSGGGWGLHQEGTYAPDSDHRWMPSIAQNAAGDIMVGYSVSSDTTFPSIRYAGRRASDPLGELTLGEGLIVAGSGSQTGLDRWGDYSAMSVDPSDEMTFWYTTEYYETTSSSGWQTRIASMEATDEPQLVELNVVPSTGEPLIAPPQGQGLVFEYVVRVDNNGPAPLVADIWNTISLPTGEEIGPVQFTPIEIEVGPGEFFQKAFKFEFPGKPAPNTYVFNMKVGDFPNVQIDRDTFVMIREE